MEVTFTSSAGLQPLNTIDWLLGCASAIYSWSIKDFEMSFGSPVARLVGLTRSLVPSSLLGLVPSSLLRLLVPSSLLVWLAPPALLIRRITLTVALLTLLGITCITIALIWLTVLAWLTILAWLAVALLSLLTPLPLLTWLSIASLLTVAWLLAIAWLLTITLRALLPIALLSIALLSVALLSILLYVSSCLLPAESLESHEKFHSIGFTVVVLIDRLDGLARLLLIDAHSISHELEEVVEEGSEFPCVKGARIVLVVLGEDLVDVALELVVVDVHATEPINKC